MQMKCKCNANEMKCDQMPNKCIIPGTIQYCYSNIPKLLSAEVVLCMHNTTTSASLDYCHKLTNPYLHQFSSISSGNCIRLTVSSFDSQANQSNQCYIQRELLMPSPEVIDLTLSDNETQPDPVRSNQDTSTPFPQVGDILSEEEDSESEQELIV